ncbi:MULTISPECIES: hypothetical protein [Hwangdonia]|uniref:Glutaminyl-tRNA synthetase n=1 Tax=Hwangdonia seohaensis TaxID=1240727 RepID=A0ABW3R921_9FLAO|nr:hypothetical protein [Hwangdonia seohaensis]
MKTYQNIESVERDLKILNLERQIAFEEIKALREEYKQDLKPLNWIQSGLKIFGKLGGMILLKKIIK